MLPAFSCRYDAKGPPLAVLADGTARASSHLIRLVRSATLRASLRQSGNCFLALRGDGDSSRSKHYPPRDKYQGMNFQSGRRGQEKDQYHSAEGPERIDNKNPATDAGYICDPDTEGLR
jgi:hypothetical protein